MKERITIPRHKDHRAIFDQVKGPHDVREWAFSPNDDYISDRDRYTFCARHERDEIVTIWIVRAGGELKISGCTTHEPAEIEAYARAHRFLTELLSDHVEPGRSRWGRLLEDDLEAAS